MKATQCKHIKHITLTGLLTVTLLASSTIADETSHTVVTAEPVTDETHSVSPHSDEASPGKTYRPSSTISNSL